MKVRNAIAVVTVAALSLALSACSSEPAATAPTTGATQEDPATTASATPNVPDAPAKANGELRPIQEGFDLASVSATLRSGFPSYASKTDEDVEVILNAACDAMDSSGTPQAGADMIQTYDIEPYDAAFSVSAAIQLYCPEYVAFLGAS